MSGYLKGRNASHTYLRRFFAETDKVDAGEAFTVEGSGDIVVATMTYGDVVDAIMGAPEHEQVKIANMIRRIDMVNGDVTDYLRHLGRCLVRMAGGE